MPENRGALSTGQLTVLRGLKHSAIAERLGKTNSYISKVVSGDMRCSASQAEALANLINEMVSEVGLDQPVNRFMPYHFNPDLYAAENPELDELMYTVHSVMMGSTHLMSARVILQNHSYDPKLLELLKSLQANPENSDFYKGHSLRFQGS